MNYFTERSMAYYFLLSEIAECGLDDFKFIAETFGVSAETAEEYCACLVNPTLAELTTLEEIAMYRKYLEGFCKNEGEFGKAQKEEEVLDAKTLALQKANDMFGANPVKSIRLKTLSQGYHRDQTASVLYCLQVLLLNPEERGKEFVRHTLKKELEEGKNSDAGLVLLSLIPQKKEVLALIARTPDMLVHPEVIEELARRFNWEGGASPYVKKAIGF